eukprot:73867-Chlamydomonas_euryale.AAC.1
MIAWPHVRNDGSTSWTHDAGQYSIVSPARHHRTYVTRPCQHGQRLTDTGRQWCYPGGRSKR